MKGKILCELDRFDYERFLFLIEVKSKNKNLNVLGSNEIFFKNMENKLSSKIYKKLFLNSILSSDLFFTEFMGIYPKFEPLFSGLYKNNNKKLFEDLFYVYLPLCNSIYNLRNIKNKPLIIGLQAHIGSGKTTMCNILNYLLQNVYELNSNSMSIDDIYLTHVELERLKKQDKMFKYRGPPGTHDIKLGINILNKVKNCEFNYQIPRYDKTLNNGLGDRSENGILITKPLDVLIYEGWFLGADPIQESELNFLGSKDKQILQHQKNINSFLKNYQNMFKMIDFYIILKPFSYEQNKIWRENAQKVKESFVQDFIKYFWDSLPPEIYLDKIEEKRNPLLTILIDENRRFYV